MGSDAVEKASKSGKPVVPKGKSKKKGGGKNAGTPESGNIDRKFTLSMIPVKDTY